MKQTTLDVVSDEGVGKTPINVYVVYLTLKFVLALSEATASILREWNTNDLQNKRRFLYIQEEIPINLEVH